MNTKLSYGLIALTVFACALGTSSVALADQETGALIEGQVCDPANNKCDVGLTCVEDLSVKQYKCMSNASLPDATGVTPKAKPGLTPGLVSPQTPTDNSGNAANDVTNNGNSGNAANDVTNNGSSGGLQNPLGFSDISGFLTAILGLVVTIGGIVVVLMLVYVGFLFVWAQGEPGAITEAKNALLWTIIGALILLGAQAISLGIQATVGALGTSSSQTTPSATVQLPFQL